MKVGNYEHKVTKGQRVCLGCQARGQLFEDSPLRQAVNKLFFHSTYTFLSNSAQAQSSSPAATMESSRGPPRVKNKAPAPQQISAEQLLREAVDRQEPGLQAPTQRFADLEELHEFQGRKRKEFEDYVRRNRINMNVSCSIPSKGI
jgi:hypothetical protein